MDDRMTGQEPNENPSDVGTDLPNQRTGDQDLPEEPGATGDHMPEGGVRDEDNDIASTPID